MEANLGPVYEQFPRIENPDKRAGQTYFFGGNQSWYARRVAQLAGCGDVAAANCFAAIAATRPRWALKLGLHYDKNGHIPFDVWMKLMDSVYDVMGSQQIPFVANQVNRQHSLAKTMKASTSEAVRKKGEELEKRRFTNFPAALGNSVFTYMLGVRRYAAMLHEEVDFFTKSTLFAGREDALLFIREGLAKGVPVVLLTALNRHELHTYGQDLSGDAAVSKNKEPHFMAITAVRRRPADGETELIISNYGKVVGIPLENLWRSWRSPLAASGVLTYFVLRDG